jgi:hypothetical protein
MPAWTSDMERHSGTANAASGMMSFAWSDFASCYMRLAEENRPSTVTEHVSSRAIAERTVMLLEKVMAASDLCDNDQLAGKEQSSDNDLDVTFWFHAEVGRWATQLGIIDDSRHRPVAFSTQDLVEQHPESGLSMVLVGALTKEACRSIIAQAALVTRLRSVDAKNPNTLDEKIKQAHHLASSVYLPRSPLLELDLVAILLEEILETGYTGELLAQLLPNVSESFAQAHLEKLIAGLHVLQANEDREKVLAKHKTLMLHSVMEDEALSTPSKKRKT